MKHTATKNKSNSAEKKKKQENCLPIATVLFCLLPPQFSSFIATKGFDYVKDNIIGHPTKELLEGEWVKK
jgi:hypothetical protein